MTLDTQICNVARTTVLELRLLGNSGALYIAHIIEQNIDWRAVSSLPTVLSVRVCACACVRARIHAGLACMRACRWYVCVCVVCVYVKYV